MNTGAINVARVRIRNVQRQMVIAVRLMEIDRVNSFRGALIAFVFLWTDGSTAERDSICLKRVTVLQQRQSACGFFYKDAVSHRSAGKGIKVQVRRGGHADGKKAKQQEENQKQFQRR